MKDRIKEIRKERHMSQAEFGKTLGVSRDVISNYEMGRVEPTDLFINHLCATFGVNEEWLRSGTGEMFIKSKQSIIDELVEVYNLDVKEKAIIQAFLELSPQGRAGVLEYVDKLVGSIGRSAPSRDEQIAQRISDTNKMVENAVKESIQK